MNQVNTKRVRISRIKPKASTVMSQKEQLSAIFELMGIEPQKNEAPMLASSKNLMRAVEYMVEPREDMGKIEWVAHDKLFKHLERCADLEADLKKFGLLGSYSPSAFLNEIKKGSDSDVKYDTLVERKKNAKQNLDSFITQANEDEKLENKSVSELAVFKAELQKLISIQESYHYIEATDGFFSFEVISTYHQFLKNALDELTDSKTTIH